MTSKAGNDASMGCLYSGGGAVLLYSGHMQNANWIILAIENHCDENHKYGY